MTPTELIMQMQKIIESQQKNICRLTEENEQLREINTAYQRLLAMLMQSTKSTMVVDQEAFNNISTEFVFEQNIGGNVIVRYVGQKER